MQAVVRSGDGGKATPAGERLSPVVANIPFNITTDIVKLLPPKGDILSEVILLVQDEIALRLVESSLRTSEYRPINIFVSFYSGSCHTFLVFLSTMAESQETNKNIEIWKIKKLIKALEAIKGIGTIMISLIMPPRDQISRVTKMLGDEFGTVTKVLLQ